MSASTSANALARMELRRAAKKAREWTIRRDDLIREMHANGSSLRAIGEEAGLTHSAIAKIVAK